MTEPRLFGVVACMRNEGQFLLEWVAYQQLVGFDRVFLVTNDCEDGTDEMAERLSRISGIVHIRNVVPEGRRPQAAGMDLALSHPAMADVEWLLHCDADEFLAVEAGGGQVRDLVDAVLPADAIAICWRHMGSGGMRDWTGGSVLESFTRSSKIPRRDAERHKCLFRPARFASAIDHMPKTDDLDGLTLKDTLGREMNPIAMIHPTQSQFRKNRALPLTWEGASLYHYSAKSQDVFLMKNFRGTGMSGVVDKYILGSPFWLRADRNRLENRRMLAHLPAVKERIRGFREDSHLRALDDAARDWFRARKTRLLTEERRAAWSEPTNTTANPAHFDGQATTFKE